MSDGPKVLTLDLETSPNLADVWGLWDQNVALSQLREVTAVIAFAAKWRHDKHIEFRSDFHDGHDAMIRRAHQLFDEADILVTYNGKKFDTPHLRREFLLAGLKPPAPVMEIDLLAVVKSRFRFSSNKLDHVSRQVGIGGKTAHHGHELWVECLRGDEKAWALMRKYNINDVRITERLYDRLRPWITSHPNVNLWTGEAGTCPSCGGRKLQRRGFRRTAVSVFQRLQCQGCGAWSSEGKRLTGADVRSAG